MEQKLSLSFEKIKCLEKSKIKKLNDFFIAYYIMMMKKITPYAIDSSICMLYCVVKLGDILVPMYEKIIYSRDRQGKISGSLEKTRQKNEMIREVIQNNYKLCFKKAETVPVWLMTSHIYPNFVNEFKKTQKNLDEIYEDYFNRLNQIEMVQLKIKKIFELMEDEDLKEIFQPFDLEISMIKANFHSSCIEIHHIISIYEKERGTKECKEMRNKFETFIW